MYSSQVDVADPFFGRITINMTCDDAYDKGNGVEICLHALAKDDLGFVEVRIVLEGSTTPEEGFQNAAKAAAQASERLRELALARKGLIQFMKLTGAKRPDGSSPKVHITTNLGGRSESREC